MFPQLYPLGGGLGFSRLCLVVVALQLKAKTRPSILECVKQHSLPPEATELARKRSARRPPSSPTRAEMGEVHEETVAAAIRSWARQITC